ncbi:hypothetical protein P2Q02_13165 [Bacillus pumilus]|uniref:hypothetical protein n=1 Tax=Bacillus TaxID=1386 RepID=UPI000D045B7A|nr:MULTISPECIES: hypothetical protein [Bacillus]MDF2003585.1 hypothetical protein [Bacillus pumilus]MDF2024628.1 hypothetical protein [Bacillus pumilus]MDF2028466.1 hypothetical protein [Bacillus pumilus]MDF2089513.1 hypothetical protein [Bacillus pumilus]MDG4728495.1 hypothetical protein [Bacillus pumilus]
MKHQMTFDARKEAQLCLVQAGGWITFHHQKPVFVFSTAEDKQTYMTLLAEKFAEAKKEESRRRETMEANYDNSQMLAQSE